MTKFKNQPWNLFKRKFVSFTKKKVNPTPRVVTGIKNLNTYSLLKSCHGVNYYLWNGSEFNPNQPTFIVTHGWRAKGAKSGVFQKLLAAIKARATHANVILVDWTEYSTSLNYTTVKNNTLKVGDWVRNFLIDLKINPATTTLIGHSLGAHILGNAGDGYRKEIGRSINTIIALEPAGPLYSTTCKGQRLDDGDAAHVVALHSTDFIGYKGAIGDVDIYLNDWSYDSQSGLNGLLSAGLRHLYPVLVLTDLFEGKRFKQGDNSSFSLTCLYTRSGSSVVKTI
ncbi:MAG: hypothetical protein AAGD25_10745 [Cyanobacteria bacterium P01_F01_bin.150]